MIFLGLASNYSAKDLLSHLFCLGTKKDYIKLERELAKRYNSSTEQTSLVYSGRTAICLALESFISSGKIKKGDHVAINGFTCKAVPEAIKKAGLVPVYLDIEKDSPDFSPKTLERAISEDKKLKVFILQNTFGIPSDVRQFEEIKQKHDLLIIEDLAHCAGRKYPDGREIGTVGDATCLSFGKGKAIDTIIGGAVVLRNDFSFPTRFKKEHLKSPKISDSMRAGWYPLFGAIARGLSHIHLEKLFLALILKCHWIEKSADTKLDKTRTITTWQAYLVLKKLKTLRNTPLRTFYLVENREACLAELKKHGFRLEEFWYEVPVSPKRYFDAQDYPREKCPNSVDFSEHVLNLPTWYSDKKHKKEIKEAEKIIERYRRK